jgi:hypothetical protein
MEQKKLPIGNQDFHSIISKDRLYVDKTELIYGLLNDQNHYFLSRPRRFGKSLLLDTIHSLFKREDNLFKGLWIERHLDAIPKLPVIHLTMPSEAESPKILAKNILIGLKRNAELCGLEVEGDSPGIYFSGLIQAYSLKNDSQIAVLIDEYDAPVTRNMDDLKVAEANAKILHGFFAVLKDNDVSKRVRFTLVTGITRYALTSMDSGPNHLDDISLNPKYAALCGFTPDEFDAYFAGHMEWALKAMQKTGRMPETAEPADLRDQIFDWYDGYSWGGESRILNPFSILKFFDQQRFDSYWIQSGRPAHLTAMIKAQPESFVELKLKQFLSAELRKTELTALEPVPVLFHSGYLTLDNISLATDSTNREAGLNENSELYSFRLPNYEVSSSYYKDCFKVIFEYGKFDFAAKGPELQMAFLAKDAKKVIFIISEYLSQITYNQYPKGESLFHAVIQSLLMGMGFKIDSEKANASGRLDLLLQIGEEVYLIIELKYVPNNVAKKANKLASESEKEDLEVNKLIIEAENEVLADSATALLSDEEQAKAVAAAFAKKFGRKKYLELISGPFPAGLTKTEKALLAAGIAGKELTEAELSDALALAVRSTINEDEIEKILEKAALGDERTLSRIEAALSKASRKALKDIKTRNYQGGLRIDAMEIIDMGVAVYGDGSVISVAFGEGWKNAQKMEKQPAKEKQQEIRKNSSKKKTAPEKE